MRQDSNRRQQERNQMTREQKFLVGEGMELVEVRKR